MKFDPLTEEQLQVAALLPDGIYNYQVIKAEDKISQAGNEYTSITLKIWDNDGKEHLVFTNMALIKLLKHFCDANGMQDEYKLGDIAAESFLHKTSGRVVIGVEGEKPDGKGGMYKAKNIVKDYIAAPQGSLLTPLTPKDDFINDIIPF